jgi:hypothetical protein
MMCAPARLGVCVRGSPFASSLRHRPYVFPCLPHRVSPGRFPSPQAHNFRDEVLLPALPCLIRLVPVVDDLGPMWDAITACSEPGTRRDHLVTAAAVVLREAVEVQEVCEGPDCDVCVCAWVEGACCGCGSCLGWLAVIEKPNRSFIPFTCTPCPHLRLHVPLAPLTRVPGCGRRFTGFGGPQNGRPGAAWCSLPPH